MAKIFLSHSNEDRELLESRIVPTLREAGHEPWYSKHDIPASHEWERSILGALESCDWFLLAMTPAAGKSKWVQSEVYWATENRWGRIIPVLLLDCKRTNFHIRIPQIQHVDFRLPSDEARQGLIAALELGQDLVGELTDSQADQKSESSQPQLTISAPRSHFHCGPWVPSEFFIGREEQLDEARRLIDVSQSFLIVGHPRAGKTSFCRKLEKDFGADVNSDTLVSYLNLQQCSDLNIDTFMEHTILNIVAEIARTVFGCRYMNMRRASPAEGNPELENDPAFETFVEIYRHVSERTHAMDAVASQRLDSREFVLLTKDLLEIAREKGRNKFLLLYDEANRLPVEISGGLLLSIAEALNETGVTGGYVASPDMENNFDELDQIFGNRLIVGPFPSMEMMKQLLARYYFDDATAAADLPASEQALQSLWQLSEGVPFLIQLIADYSFRVARNRRSDKLGVDHIDEAFRVARKERPAAFKRK